MTAGLVLTIATLFAATCGVVLATPTAGAALSAALALASLTLAAHGPRVRRALIVGAVACGAMAHGAAARDRVIAPPLATWAGPDTSPRQMPVVVIGTLAEDAAALESGVRLLIDVDAIDGERVTGRVQAYAGGDLAGASQREWTAGRRIRVPMTLRRPPLLLNPGGPSERWQTLRRPFALAGSIKSALLVEVAPGRWWDEWAAAIRAIVRQRVAALFTDPSDETGAVIVAILIGDRSWLDDATERRLQVAGTYHVIAISGGNVALVTAGIYLCLRLLVRSPRAIAVLTMSAVAAYGWIAGGDASVTRAVIAAIVYLAIGMAGLVPPALNVLALVALIVTVVDPLATIDAGAWLSFGATFGIIAGARRVSAWHDRRWPAAAVRRACLGLLAATLAAELALLPVAAALFNRVGVAGLVLNALAIPAIAVVQIAGLAGIVCVGVWTGAAGAAAAAARFATMALIGSAALIDYAPWSSWRVPAPEPALVVVFYASGLAWLAVAAGAWRRVALATFAACAVAIATAPAIERRAPAAGVLRVTAVDVGQGDSILVQFPTGRSLLVDAGGAAGGFDVGERVVSRVLWASGVRRLDWLAVTHADLDHIGGAPAVAATFAPHEIWEGVPVPRDRRRARLMEAPIPWREALRNDRLTVGGVTVDVLNPPRADWERQRVRNDDSIVLRLRYGSVDVLLTGDIGADTERAILDDEPRAPIRVLKVAHHGSRTSSSPPFLERFRPDVALISAGRGNPFGHPAAEVLDRLSAVGTRVFRTDRDGATIIETDGRALTVRSMRGRAWTMHVWRTPA